MHSAVGHIAFNPGLDLVNDGLLHPQPRDFEEAVVDEEAGGRSPLNGRNAPARSRRGTVETLDPRSVSPPNSVKAFADARRRERELSTNDSHAARAFAETRRQSECDVPLQRLSSGGSGRSRRTRRCTDDNDGMSFAGSSKSAEEDVCFPLRATADKDTLQIDFEVLEDFIAEEESRAKTPPKNQPQPRIFDDLRTQNQEPTQIFSADGDFISSGSISTEKHHMHDAASSVHEDNPIQQQTDGNRFEYFSSLGESTIHAAEFGDLILPGEDIRTLFTFPQGEELDGVWWLNMNNPTDEEIRAICKAFGVHPLTIEDIGTQEAREKIELFPSYYFACFRSFHVEEIEGGQEYQPFNIYVVVFREGTLSFSFSANPHAPHVRKRIIMLKDYVALSSDWICYALM
jgi:magnesium transporter